MTKRGSRPTSSNRIPAVPAIAIGQMPNKIVLLRRLGLNSISARLPAVQSAVASMTRVKKMSKLKWTSVFQKVLLNATTSEVSPRTAPALPFAVPVTLWCCSSSSSSSNALRGSGSKPAPAGPRTEKRFQDTVEERSARRVSRFFRAAVGTGVRPSWPLPSSSPPSRLPPPNVVPFVRSRRLTPLPPAERILSLTT